MWQSQSFRCFSIVFNKSKAEHSSLSSQFYYLCAITIQFQGLAEMDFVCFKVLKTSKQGNLEEGRGEKTFGVYSQLYTVSSSTGGHFGS